jgi:hypothetical protein
MPGRVREVFFEFRILSTAESPALAYTASAHMRKEAECRVAGRGVLRPATNRDTVSY